MREDLLNVSDVVNQPMTPAEVRVAVCKEALRLSEQPSLAVSTGTFIALSRNSRVPSSSTELQAVIRDSTSNAPIRFCAVGGAVLGYASLFDNLPLSEFEMGYDGPDGSDSYYFAAAHHSASNTMAIAARIFTPRTVAAMEAAFELGRGAVRAVRAGDGVDYASGGLCDPGECELCDQDRLYESADTVAAIEFGRQFDDTKARFQAIMKRVIANNGEFFAAKEGE